MITRTEQRTEAANRMAMLGLWNSSIRIFQDYHMVPKFKDNDWSYVATDDLSQRFIDEFEQEYGALVYAVVPTCEEFPKKALLFISKDDTVWDSEKARIESSNVVRVYVPDLKQPENSTFGYIKVENVDGSIMAVEW